MAGSQEPSFSADRSSADVRYQRICPSASWYFESDDLSHRRALDDLLMVQGWRRYDWERMAGRSPFELKYMPEQGIELHGKVVSMVRSKPRANVEVTAFLASPGDDPESKNQNSLIFLPQTVWDVSRLFLR